MAFELPPLPYAPTALAEAGMSLETLELHHGKHHQAYVTALNGFVDKSDDLKGKTLEEIVLYANGKADLASVFNNAGQHWNHILFWQSLSPKGGRLQRVGSKAHGGLRRRRSLQGNLQGRRDKPVRFRLGMACARQGWQAQGDQERQW